MTLQLAIVSLYHVILYQNCEIKSRNNLFLFFIQWRKRASIKIKINIDKKKKNY